MLHVWIEISSSEALGCCDHGLSLSRLSFGSLLHLQLLLEKRSFSTWNESVM
jgi:hypothetical protein